MLLFSCHSSSSLSVSFWRTTARKWDVRPLFSLSSHCFWWERLKHPFSSIGFIFQMSIPLFSSLIIKKASFASFLLFDTRHPNFLLGFQFRPFCSLVIQCILSLLPSSQVCLQSVSGFLPLLLILLFILPSLLISWNVICDSFTVFIPVCFWLFSLPYLLCFQKFGLK